jgi:hypothetical protein
VHSERVRVKCRREYLCVEKFKNKVRMQTITRLEHFSFFFSVTIILCDSAFFLVLSAWSPSDWLNECSVEDITAFNSELNCLERG